MITNLRRHRIMAGKKKSEQRIDSVGRRIRALRLARNMSIEDLGKKTSVSSVTISNIEKGIYSPKLNTILEIAKALDTTIIHLIEDVDEPKIFKIEKNKQRLESAEGIVLHDFGPIMMDKRMTVYIMEMEKDASTVEHDSFDGNEFIHVLSGEVSVAIEDKTHTLVDGESLYFHGSYRHTLNAVKPAKIVFISTNSP